MGEVDLTEYKNLLLPVWTKCPWCLQGIDPNETIYWDSGAPHGQKAIHVACFNARKAKSS